MSDAELKATVLDIIRENKERAKRSKKRHGRLPEVDNHTEKKERELIEQNDRADFESIYHDYDLDRAVRGV